MQMCHVLLCTYMYMKHSIAYSIIVLIYCTIAPTRTMNPCIPLMRTYMCVLCVLEDL